MYHSFDTEIAEKYGILEAVIINNFSFWIAKNEANEIHFHDGRYWTYNTTKALAELFPYASKRQIEKALNHLREEGVIMVGNYNTDARVRTLWYAFTDLGKCISPNGEMQITDWGNVNINVNNTDIKTTDRKQGEMPDLSAELAEAVEDFKKMRKGIKAPMTDRALKRLLNKLDGMASDDETKIAILDQSIMNCWKDVYPLHEEKKTVVDDDFDVVAHTEEMKRMGYL